MICRTLIFLVPLIQIALTVEYPVLELPTGKILGRQAKNIADTPYYAFEKIPYAAPPIGSLRFKAPQPAQPWDGILNTTYLDASCIQHQGVWDTDTEDCLFVNVYTPALPEDDVNASLPVMLFIYGGGFTSGRAIDYRPDLFVEAGVILVTINYRIGVFGFLSTGDDIIPGNSALKDQQLAIQWTHQNIHIFGGNAERITIFGESAGSASVAYQLLYQNSEGLFSGAIMESGSFLSTWALQRHARNIAFETAGILNSTFLASNDSNVLLEFLQSVSAEDLNAAAQQYLQAAPYEGILYAPVIEAKNPDAFITKKMYGLLETGSILKVPVIIGINSEEDLIFYSDPTKLQSVLEVFDNNLDLLVPTDMQITDTDQHAEMGKSIRNIYTNGEPFGTRLGDGIRYFSDTDFNRGSIKHAELASAFTDVYFYQFSYDGIPGNSTAHYDGADTVSHAEDLAYLFCVTILGCSFSDFDKMDYLTSQRMIKLWTDFAKYGSPIPTPSELLQNITWPKVSLEDGEFLYLDINENLEVRSKPKGNTINQWFQLYDSLDFQDFDTY